MKTITIQEIQSMFEMKIDQLENVEEYLSHDGLRLLSASRHIHTQLKNCTTYNDILNNETITIIREQNCNDTFINNFSTIIERNTNESIIEK